MDGHTMFKLDGNVHLPQFRGLGKCIEYGNGQISELVS